MKSLESKIRDILLEKNKENLKKKKEVIPPKERKKEEMSDFDPRVHLKREETDLNEGMADTASAAGSKGLQKTRDGILKSMKPQGGSDMTVQMPVPKPLLSPHTMLKHPSFVMNPHLYLPKEKPGPEAKKSVSSARDVGNRSSKLASAAGGGKNSSTTKKKVSEAVKELEEFSVDTKTKPIIDLKVQPKSNLPVVNEPKKLVTTEKPKPVVKVGSTILKRLVPGISTALTVLQPTPLNKGENEFERQKKYKEVPVKLPTIEIPSKSKQVTVTTPSEAPKAKPIPMPDSAPASAPTKTKTAEPPPKQKGVGKNLSLPGAAVLPDAYKEHGAGKYLKPRLKVHKAKMHVKEDREDIDAVARKNIDRKNLEYVGRKDKKALTRQSEIVRKIDENSTRAATLVKKVVKEKKYSNETKRYGETVVNPELNNTPLDMREGVVSKFTSRLTPGVGAAYGAMSAAEKIKQKDYSGAALAAASAAPVIGWPAVALDIARDYAKSGESGTTPMIKHPQTKGVDASKVFDRMRKSQIKEDAASEQYIHSILTTDKSAKNRKAVLTHPDVTSSHINTALSDINAGVREAAIKHPKASKDNISTGISHSDPYVQSIARKRASEFQSTSRLPIPAGGALNLIKKATKMGVAGAVGAGLLYAAPKILPVGTSHLAADIKKFSVGRKALDVGSKASDYVDNKAKEFSSDDRVKRATDYIKSKITKD